MLPLYDRYAIMIIDDLSGGNIFERKSYEIRS